MKKYVPRAQERAEGEYIERSCEGRTRGAV